MKKIVRYIMVVLILCTILPASLGTTVVKAEKAEQQDSIKQKVIKQFKEAQKNNKIKYSKDRVIVKFKENVTEQQIQDFLSENQMSLQFKLNKNGLTVGKFKKSTFSAEQLELLNSSGLVEYAEPDYIGSYSAEQYYGEQWGLKNTQNPGIDINVEPAWQKTKGNSSGTPVTVAVLDTGVAWNDIELKDRIWTNANEIAGNGKDDDGNGLIDDVRGWDFYNNDNDPMDDHFHGTHVAGIIAASENGAGIIGVAPNVKIMPIKVGSPTGPSSVSTIQGINYAVQKGAKVINLSLSLPSQVALTDAIANAGSSDVVVVVAAGNNGVNIDDSANQSFPAILSKSLTNVITVANITQTGALSSLSNYGLQAVNVAAPGTNIWSTIPGDKLNPYSGTSQAAPYVAGVAALIKDVQPGYTPTQIRDVIEQTVTPLASLQGKVKTGGLVNAGAAISKATNVAVTGVTLDQTAKPIAVGNIFQLIATITPINATNQNKTWKSSNTAVATVDTSGKVTAVAPGSATITVTTVDGSKTAICTVTVVADDYGNDLATAFNWSLTLGTTNSKNGNLEIANDVDMFKFTAPVAGTYTFYSTNRVPDVKGWLYNSSGTELTNNDDGNGDLNFKITYDLVQGQVYYLKVSHYAQNGAGSYTVNISAPSYGLIKDVFPDSVLANYIAGQLGKTVTAVFTADDAKKITKIKSLQGVSNAKGIEYLTELTYLDLWYGNLTSIDVSKNTKLTFLYLPGNQLTSLDVSKNTELTRIGAYDNQLTSIDLSKNVNLDFLEIEGNKLNQLNISNNLKLTYLNAGSNNLTSIDVSKNIELTNIDLYTNQLSSIDVSKNQKLVNLSVHTNKITSINVTNNLSLEKLGISYNKIQTVDVTKNIKLTSLWAEGNQLTTLDLTKNPELYNLWVFSNNIKQLDISKNPKLLYINVDSFTTLIR